MTAFDFFNIICSIPKTLRFNLHYFPLKTALKLPVVVSHRTYLRELQGKVELPEKVERAMVKIGFWRHGEHRAWLEAFGARKFVFWRWL